MQGASLRSFTTRGGVQLEFSPLGFGCAPLGNMHRVLSEPEAERVLEAAWRAGGRYYDTAPLYGHGLSETRVGAFLRGLPSGQFLVSTKVGRLLQPCGAGEEDSGIYKATPQLRVHFDYTRDGVMRSFEDSVRRLAGLRPDILLVHDLDPVTHADVDRRWRELFDEGGWQALEELRSNGDVAAIGAGVNEVGPCLRLLNDSDPDLFLIAGRHTLLDRSASLALVPKCERRGVGLVVGGPFNSGILATGAFPGAMYAYAPAPLQILRRVEAIEGVCRDHGVSLPAAAIQFPMRDASVVAVIPGGQTQEQVIANAAAMKVEIPNEFWGEVDRVLAEGDVAEAKS